MQMNHAHPQVNRLCFSFTSVANPADILYDQEAERIYILSAKKSCPIFMTYARTHNIKMKKTSLKYSNGKLGSRYKFVYAFKKKLLSNFYFFDTFFRAIYQF